LTPRAWCEWLGVRVPLVQAPVGGASNPELVSAVCDAGAFGFLSGTWRDQAVLAEMVGAIQRTTSGPFGVNFVLEWDMASRVDLCLSLGVRHFGFFWGDPEPFVDRIHAASGTVWASVGSVDEAKRVLDAGADVVVAQGWEAGGHVRGTTGLASLVPDVVDVAGSVPVVAAGGIVDGRGLVAVLCLGAAAACAGTAFLVAEEAATHPEYRRRLIEATGDEAVHTTVFDGGWTNAAHRVLRNRSYDAWVAAGSPPPGRRPGEGDVIAMDPEGDPVVRYTSHLPRPGGVGDVGEQALYAGQGIGRVSRVRPAREIVAEFARGLDAPGLSLDWPAAIG